MPTVELSLLRNIPLFAKLSETELKQLAELLGRKTLVPNETLFWIGDKGSDFCIIQSGEIELYYLNDDGKEHLAAKLKPGQFFGELSLLDGGPRTATARSSADTTLLCLGRVSFEQYLLHHSAVAFHILTVLGQRQREMTDKLKGIKNVNQAVAEAYSSKWHTISDLVTRVMASPYFIVSQLVLFGIWVIINANMKNGFDAYPFSLLSLVVGAESVFLASFLLVSQNRAGERDRLKSDLDYQINMKAHMEVLQLHQKVDRLEQLVKEGQKDFAEYET